MQGREPSWPGERRKGRVLFVTFYPQKCRTLPVRGGELASAVCSESLPCKAQGELESWFTGRRVDPAGGILALGHTISRIPILEDAQKVHSMRPLPRKTPGPRNEGKITLKTVTSQRGLTPETVSAALNNSPAARSIPAHTKNRIIEAANALNYRRKL